MTDESVVAIARIPLARAPLRVLVGPMVLVLVALLVAAAGWLLLPDPLRLLSLPVGLSLAVLAGLLAIRMLSVSLEVEVSTLRVRGIGADLRFSLVRGAVTRIWLEGEGAARLRQRLGPFGWGAGRATLRGEETIHVVRLAPTPSLIIVPTDGGRVGIAPASEEQLLAALGAAARVQQRLDQVAARARSLPIDRLVEAPRPAPPPPPPPVRDPGRALTGIERVRLEQRLAAERAAALAAAEAERRDAAEEAARAAAEKEQRAAMAAIVGRELPSPARSPALPRPSLPRPHVTLPRPHVTLPRPHVTLPRPHVTLPRPHVTLPRPHLTLPAAGRLPEEDAGRYLVAVVPLLVAVLVWAFATVSGRLPIDEDEARLVGLTLALGGPAAALGVLAARAWFPRLLGLVAVTAVCALLLVGRALLG